MNKKIFISAVALMCAAMTACTAANDGENNASEMEIVTAEVSEETTSETTETAAETTSLSTVETSETTALTTSETTETAVTENVPEKISVKAEDMTFTDFAFIEYYKGSKQEDETSEKAIEFLKTTEEYAQSQKYSDLYKESYPEYFDENGVIIPKLLESYTEDYDGDGRDETFLLIDMPYSNYINTDDPSDSFSAVYSFLIFIGNDGNTELLDHNCSLYYTEFIDYGCNKQLVVGGSGSCGAEDHTIIWTVRDEKALCLYAFRGGVYKQDCFISVFGWQSMGGTMIFDTEKVMYIPVDGVPCDKEEIIRMDKDKTIEILYDEKYSDWWNVSLIGGKYYCAEMGVMDSGSIYTYSDGHFVLEKNSYIRNDHTYFDDEPGYANEVFVDFDYDKVTSEMTAVKAEMPTYSVDDINEYSAEWLKEDYAEFISDDSRTYTADEVKITAFYGIYGGFYAVRMSPYDKVLLYGYEFSSWKKGFWDIETAYNNGILSESGRLMLESVINNAK